ncbi:uncharacterized protein BO97DRAFT_37301 [Aspergillus homomorphus CBS 101889]|uniref:Uncharacterized protein n=1 Tax=Aspergillus homomorphus (strain CBS 101889) TaxID=1450537 RepID=A0A395HZF3_ASPHC|nr:hypothetical protein BO97DRAFT_37301 [Aspergillus homomorphus CBS 101889]RAL13312.1 hypothetical protein BO97DRAFT_37301 [Aspergillus homomorphus CBS 101889]
MPPTGTPGPHPYRDNLNQDAPPPSRKSLSFSPIPEEESSDDDEHSSIKLHRLDTHQTSTSTSTSHKPLATATATAYAYPTTNRPSDVEAYLSSITEAERELLTAAHDFELTDDDDSDAQSVGSDVGLRKGSSAGGRHRRKSSSFRRHTPRMGWGWQKTRYYYRKVWWRALVVVGLVLAGLVWVFLRFAGKGREGGRVVVSFSFPVPSARFSAG